MDILDGNVQPAIDVCIVDNGDEGRNASEGLQEVSVKPCDSCDGTLMPMQAMPPTTTSDASNAIQELNPPRSSPTAAWPASHMSVPQGLAETDLLHATGDVVGGIACIGIIVPSQLSHGFTKTSCNPSEAFRPSSPLSAMQTSIAGSTLPSRSP